MIVPNEHIYIEHILAFLHYNVKFIRIFYGHNVHKSSYFLDKWNVITKLTKCFFFSFIFQVRSPKIASNRVKPVHFKHRITPAQRVVNYL